MPRQLLILLLLLAVGTGGVTAAAVGQTDDLKSDLKSDLIWPLDLPTRYLTSNFMEYRPGRYHAGLDLKTQTVCGFAARAVEDGWIVRVRATPGAYGRAIYLRGASGRTYVYAHLSRFNDVLRHEIQQNRARTGTYRARLEFRPNQIPVRQGEVLGLTGQSGTNGPHLHFEVRDANNRPIDPQAAGFATGDTIAPAIVTLRAWPAAAGASIEGSRTEFSLGDPLGLSGRQPELRISGPVAFSARMVDRSDIRAHRLEPARVVLRLDGEVVYRSENRGFGFGENTAARLEWTALPDHPERWLYRAPAVRVAGREGGEWFLGTQEAGLSPGRHRLELEASDQAGNGTLINWDLVVVPPGRVLAGGTAGWQRSPVSPRLVSADSLSAIELTPFFEQNSEAVWSERPGLRRYAFSPTAGDPVQAPLAIYSDTVAWTDAYLAAATKQGLTPQGTARRYQAATWALEASLPVKLEQPAAEPDSTWGLYRWTGQRWGWAGAWPAVSGAEATIAIDRRGVYAVLADRAAPWIEDLSAESVVGAGPADAYPGLTMPRWAVLAVGVGDLGSGVATGTLDVTLDGKPLIVEPDMPRDRILIEFPAEMDAGSHEIVLRIKDRAGHRATRALRIRAER